MRNYRFRFSDMIPNSWFYKLKDMGRGNNTHSKKKKQSSSAASTTHTSSSKPKQSQVCNPRKSHYFTRELTTNDRICTSRKNPKITETNSPEPPRKSSKQSLKKRTSKSSPKLVSSSVSAVWTKSDSPPEYSLSSPFDTSPEESDFLEPEFRTDRVLPTESLDEMVFWSHSNAEEDIVIDVDNNSIARKDDKLDEFNSFSELDLPPIITKPEKFNDFPSDFKKRGNRIRSRIASYEEMNVQKSLKVKIVKEDKATIRKQRRFSVNSPGVKLRIHSPRIASRKIQGHGGRRSVSAGKASRRSLSDSFAVVKSSFDPQRDFRESMMEMIVMNNIRKSKDLEDLLACYLSLNSDEYHDLIIRVFKQIWLDLTDNNR